MFGLIVSLVTCIRRRSSEFLAADTAVSPGHDDLLDLDLHVELWWKRPMKIMPSEICRDVI